MKTPAKVTAPAYENNPFLISIEGIKLLFNRAQNTAIFLAVISLVAFALGAPPESGAPIQDGSSAEVLPSGGFNLAEHWPVLAFLLITGLLFLIGVMLLATFVQAIADYTSAQLAKGKSVELSEATNQAARQYLGYLWVQVLIAVKTVLWSLLFIIPGIYKANRYSLAGIVFFAEANMRGNRAVQRSQALTDGAWITTFAGFNFFNLVTLGAISLLTGAGSRITLYRQFKALGDRPKPAASTISWLLLIIPLALLVLLAPLVILVAVA